MATEVLRRSRLPDPFRDGLAGGWKVIDASTLDADLMLEADVAIVGTGAGGGTAAEILSNAGLKVVLIEEGPLATSSDFRMREAEAYPQLYQEWYGFEHTAPGQTNGTTSSPPVESHGVGRLLRGFDTGMILSGSALRCPC